MGAKKMSKKIFDYRVLSRTAKSPVFSTISFAAIFFIIYADSLMSSISIGPADLGSKAIFGAPEAPTEAKAETRSTLPTITPVAKQEKVAEVESESVDPLIPPSNITRKERIAWFRRKLPELEILNSNDISKKFHGRILEFYNNECTVQFFMTWLSPAKTFGPREFLAMDTLFKANPRACLTIVSHTMDSVHGYTILKPLLDLGYKVLAITPDLPFLVKNTPAEPWLDEMKSGRRDPGYIPLSINLSNLVRVAMLYKYGGTYLDSDFIILKDFEGLRNAVGAQSVDEATNQWTRINGAVMIFDMNHPILLDFLREFATTFNGNKWGHNGPYLVSRVMERVGNTPGYNITILPPRAFYPVDWIKIRRLFRKPANEAESRWVEETLAGLTESYALHLWNKRSRNLIVEDGSVMDRLISEQCVVCQRINHS
uniref:Alpha 1,4-glycosyltransferase domain-containing protein n=1 Tax=Rhizophora mucronata TaxID=61149 RepID=A0A2P2IVG3_RHIMU